MANFITSVAAFEDRAKEFGILESELVELRKRGWNTFRMFVFACSYIPGQADDGPLLKMMEKVTGVSPPPEDRECILRALFFDSYTAAAAEMRRDVDRLGNEPPRTLSAPERHVRLEDQKRRLGKGVHLEDELEISNSLEDIFCDMVEKNTFRYCRWAECTRLDQEMDNVKVDPFFATDKDRVFRQTLVPRSEEADTTTDLKIRDTLTRRAIAIDRCRLANFETWEE